MRWTGIMIGFASSAGLLSFGWSRYPRAISPPPQRRDIPLKRYNVADDIRHFLLAGYSCVLDSIGKSGWSA